MNPDPRYESDYTLRQIEAAHRVLMDVGQVLASFGDCMVVVGGWVPDLLIADAEEPHVGSIDVDFALDAAKLNDGRYAGLLKLLIDTKRYRKGSKDFQLLWCLSWLNNALIIHMARLLRARPPEDGGCDLRVPRAGHAGRTWDWDHS